MWSSNVRSSTKQLLNSLKLFTSNCSSRATRFARRSSRRLKASALTCTTKRLIFSFVLSLKSPKMHTSFQIGKKLTISALGCPQCPKVRTGNVFRIIIESSRFLQNLILSNSERKRSPSFSITWLTKVRGSSR